MDLTTTDAAALWLGVAADDPHLARLVTVASGAVASFLDRDMAQLVPMPPVIEHATLETVANLYRNRTQNPLIASMSLGDGSVSFRDLTDFEVIPPSAKSLLGPYRRFHLTSC